jgi:P4 family phage/plasmid primase-like protien
MSFEERLSKSLVMKYNKRIYAIPKGIYEERRINTVHFSVLFGLMLKIEYDERVCCFFRYRENQGIWEATAEERVRQKLVELMIPYADQNMAIYNPQRSTFQEILYHLKALLLHDDLMLREKNRIAVRNGVVVMGKKFELYPHSWTYKLRNAVSTDFDPARKTPTGFLQMLTDAGLSQKDKDMLQFWSGMVLLGINPFHKIMLIQGVAGSGKSTLINIIEKIIGHVNVATLSTMRLEERFELSEFFGKTLLVGKDVGEDFLSTKSSHMLKSLSGDSGLKAEVKFVQARVRLGGPFNIALTTNLNLRVRLAGDADAWARRLWILQFKEAVPEKDRKPNYDDHLIEREGECILYWMLLGAREVLDTMNKGSGSFDMDDAQKKRVQDLLFHSNELDAFVKSDVVKSPGSSLTTEELYVAYCNYCARHMKDAVSKTAFAHRIGTPLYANYNSQKGYVSSTAGITLRGYSDISFNATVIMGLTGSTATTGTTATPATSATPGATATTTAKGRGKGKAAGKSSGDPVVGVSVSDAGGASNVAQPTKPAATDDDPSTEPAGEGKA